MKHSRMHQYASLLIVSIMIGAGTMLLDGRAYASPSCDINHGVKQVPDAVAGYHMLMEINVKCNSNSAVYKMNWGYSFWAEPQGGGKPQKVFTSGGKPYFEKREIRGGETLIQVTAPRGFGRYCYQAQGTLFVPPIVQNADKSNYMTGVNCKET